MKETRRRSASLVALFALLLSAIAPMAAFAQAVDNSPNYMDPVNPFPAFPTSNQSSNWTAWAQLETSNPNISCDEASATEPFELASPAAFLIINAATPGEERSSVWRDPGPGLYVGQNDSVSNVHVCTLPPGASVTIQKLWTVDGDDVDAPDGAAPTFTVALLDGPTEVASATDVAPAVPVTFDDDDGLVDGTTYDVTVSEDADSIPADIGGCDFVDTTYSFDPDSEQVTAGVPAGTITVTATNAYECDDTPQPPRLQVDKALEGGNAPSDETEFTVCLVPVPGEPIGEVVTFDSADLVLLEVDPCATISVDEGHDFGELLPGDYELYEVIDEDDPAFDDFVEVDFSSDQGAGFLTLDDEDDARVAFTIAEEDDATITITVVNTYTTTPPPPPPPPGPESVSVSVEVVKLWSVDGQLLTPTDLDGVPTFDVTLGTTASQVLEGAGTATFPGLEAGTSYDVTVTEDEDTLPDAEALFGDGCSFVESSVSPSTTSVQAPGSVRVTVTNFYVCPSETSVLPEPPQEQPEVLQPVPDATPAPQVEAAVVRGVTRTALPVTGAPVVLLALLGLLSVGLGSGMLATRRRG